MPRLIDVDSRTDSLVAAINKVLCEDGVPGLSLRRIARESGVSTSSMLHHYGSREHLMRVAASRTGRARLSDARSRMSFQGIAGFLPDQDYQLPDARAWLAWLELWRSEERLVSTIAYVRDSERGLLAHTVRLPSVSSGVESVVAMSDGLLVALCQPTRPLTLEVARQLLVEHADRVGPPDVTPWSASGSTG